jgi:DNA processing protein
MRPQLRYLVGISLLPGIGPQRFFKLLDLCGDPERAYRASETQLRALGVDGKMLPQLLERRRTLDLDREMQRLEALSVTVLSRDDPDYPPRLKEI